MAVPPDLTPTVSPLADAARQIYRIRHPDSFTGPLPIASDPWINGRTPYMQKPDPQPLPQEFYAPGYVPVDNPQPTMQHLWDNTIPGTFGNTIASSGSAAGTATASVAPSATPTSFNLSSLDAIAQKYGIDPTLFRSIARIESSGDPNAGAGGPYKGLFQLSSEEFAKTGGSNIFDPVQNATAAAANLAAERAQFTQKFGRPPSPTELYLIHQQGFGGLSSQLANPQAPAWQNMASTGEGQQKGAAWAKEAVWGNVPDDIKAKFPGGVDSLTGQQFLDLWNQKVAGFTGADPGSIGGGGSGAPGARGPNALLAGLPGSQGQDPRLALANLLARQTQQAPLSTVSPTGAPNLLAAQVRPATISNPYAMLGAYPSI